MRQAPSIKQKPAAPAIPPLAVRVRPPARSRQRASGECRQGNTPVAGFRKELFERLEPCVGKLTSTVLRGTDGSNAVRLPDKSPSFQNAQLCDFARSTRMQIAGGDKFAESGVAPGFQSGYQDPSCPLPL
jgi:hypothetical protein